MDEVMKHALRGPQDSRVEMGNSEGLHNLNYTDDSVYLFEPAKRAQLALGRLIRDIAPLVICFAFCVT